MAGVNTGVEQADIVFLRVLRRSLDQHRGVPLVGKIIICNVVGAITAFAIIGDGEGGGGEGKIRARTDQSIRGYCPPPCRFPYQSRGIQAGPLLAGFLLAPS